MPEKTMYQKSSTTGSIVVLDLEANFEESESVAEKYGGRLPTLQEFLIQLKSNRTLSEKAKGNDFWLGGAPGLRINGDCRIDFEKGTVAPIREKELGSRQGESCARVFSGKGHIAVNVYYGWGSRRLDISAAYEPQYVASCVAVIVDTPTEDRARRALIRK